MNNDIAAVAKRHNFVLISSEDIPEIEGCAYVMKHIASSARLLYLKNDDPNKAFSISFKTPAQDDTGVFHILEHSVLCGSRKFPVKEPFVDLLKSSMQTFLNALTFPDKTTYPVASTNEQDLLNLADVYLDAVFHPMIYSKEEIFQQEGCHLEPADDSEGTSDVPITYNGVVYNEMKGVLTEPDSVLFDALSATLFPDTTYRFESGGTPQSIPSLTYEQFLETHRRHYRCDNSYLTLYGDLDIERFLGFIDEEYLTPLANEADSYQFSGSVPDAPYPIEVQRPIIRLDVKQPMVTTSENACAALGFVVGDAFDRERLIASDILLDAIMGSNEAPLKRALLNADLADDAVGFIMDSLLQPFAVVQLKGLTFRTSADSDNVGDRFRCVLMDQIRQLADGQLDHELISAALSHAEFVMRERNFGIADGVALSVSALSGWLYDDDYATAYLHYDDAFSYLRKQIDAGYFEQLLRELFLENDHFGSVEVVPQPERSDSDQNEDLISLASTLTEQDLETIERNVTHLREVQAAPDDPKDIAKLPQLLVSDIKEAPSEGSFELENDMPVTCLRHHIATRGISYVYRYFDLSCVSFEELPYVEILAMVLGKLDTARHSALEIDTRIQSCLGNLNFFCEIYEDVSDQNAFAPKFVVGSSALAENTELCVTIANEILYETDYSDCNKILDILMQKRVSMEQDFLSAGHSVAMGRVASYYSRAAVAAEKLAGIDFYFFLKDLCLNFDDRREQVCDKLRDLARRIFNNGASLLSFTGTDEDLSRIRDVGFENPDTCVDNAVKGADTELVVPAPQNKCEAFIVPTDVSFTSIGFDRRMFNEPFSGSWLVAARVLSYDYLWNEVRVKGGAYGAGFLASRAGSMRFYSFRDPHIDETVACFRGSGAWLSSFSPRNTEMDGYIVSSVAGMDAPLKPRALLRRQDQMYFSGYSIADRLQTRDEIIHTHPEDMARPARVLIEAAGRDNVCTICSRDAIKVSQIGFNVVDLLI